MRIEIIDVTVENKGKYRVANVAYKGPDGKVEGKKVMSFANKDVFKTVSEAKQGDIFEVKSEKNEAGYWEWTSASAEGKNTGVKASNKSFEAPSRSFETAEERARKQVYITKSASINAAVELAKLNGKPITEEDVIKSAQKFIDFVFRTEGPVVASAEVE